MRLVHSQEKIEKKKTQAHAGGGEAASAPSVPSTAAARTVSTAAEGEAVMMRACVAFSLLCAVSEHLSHVRSRSCRRKRLRLRRFKQSRAAVKRGGRRKRATSTSSLTRAERQAPARIRSALRSPCIVSQVLQHVVGACAAATCSTVPTYCAQT